MKAGISTPYSLLLDVVRVMAAVTVVACHAAQIGLFTGPWPFSQYVQHAAVVVFFVLSGLVIAESTRTRECSMADYVSARVSRILPVALAGILAGNLAWHASWLWFDGMVQPAGSDRADLRNILLPMVFLGADAGPVANPPYWSLWYEVYYYAMFGAATLADRSRRTFYVLAIALLAGPRILILMPVWLAGVGLQSCLGGVRMSLARGAGWIAAGIGAMILVVSAAFGLKNLSEQWTSLGFPVLANSQFWFADWLLTPAVAAIFVGLVPWAHVGRDILAALARPIRMMAGCSFTLYMIHWPLMSFMVSAGIATRSVALFVLLLVGIFGAAFTLALFLEQKARTATRTFLQSALAARQTARQRSRLLSG